MRWTETVMATPDAYPLGTECPRQHQKGLHGYKEVKRRVADGLHPEETQSSNVLCGRMMTRTKKRLMLAMKILLIEIFLSEILLTEILSEILTKILSEILRKFRSDSALQGVLFRGRTHRIPQPIAGHPLDQNPTIGRRLGLQPRA